MKLLALLLTLLTASVSAETVWVTKYALTRGVQKFDNAQLFVDQQVVIVGKEYFKKGEYWFSEYDAKERAEQMRIARVAALIRELQRLEAIK